MKILIVNQPLYNKGDSAAHKSTLISLKQMLPGAKIEVILTNANEDAVKEFSVAGITYSKVDYIISSKIVVNLKRIFYRFFFLFKIQKFVLLFPSLNKISKKIKDSDIVVCAPGGICMGGFRNWYHVCILMIAKHFQKPIYYYSRSIGPFLETGFSNKLFKKNSVDLLNYFSFIALRDSKSAKFADVLGVKYVQTVDPVFLCNPADFINEKKDWNLPKSYVVFVPNSLTWQYRYKNVPQERIDSFYLRIVELLKHLFPNVNVVMLPQLFGTNRGDYSYFEKIKRMSNDDKIIVLPENVTSDMQQVIISKSSLVIGARYHSVVFAINNSVPFVSLSYEHKMNGLLELLGKQDCSFDLTKIFENSWNENVAIEELERLINCAKRDPQTRDKAHVIALNCMKKMVEQIELDKKEAEI